MIIDIVLWGAGIILALILFAVSAIACTPVRMSAVVDTRAQRLLEVEAAAFGGLFPAFALTARPARSITEDRKAKKPKRQNGSGNIGFLRSWPYLRRATPVLIRRMLARIKIETANADIVFGFPDPADTGVVFGGLRLVLHLVNQPSVSQVILRPSFDGTHFEALARLVVRATPIALLVPILAFAWAVVVVPRLPGALR